MSKSKHILRFRKHISDNQFYFISVNKKTMKVIDYENIMCVGDIPTELEKLRTAGELVYHLFKNGWKCIEPDYQVTYG